MLETFIQFIQKGFAHIIPDGLDHVLFVLGLFLICRRFSSLFWQVSLFTITHSITLGISTVGWLELPSKLVEVLIALSVALIAAENMWRKEANQGRSWIVAISGLLHGLGFAHAFQEHVISSKEALPALLGLSFGVELGQLAVVTTAFVLLGPFWNRSWYRKTVTVPGSFLLMLCGLFWVVQRLME